MLHVEVVAASALAHERVAWARRRLAPGPVASGGVPPNGMGDLDGGDALGAHRRQLWRQGRAGKCQITDSEARGDGRKEGGGGERGRRKQALRPVSARGRTSPQHVASRRALLTSSRSCAFRLGPEMTASATSRACRSSWKSRFGLSHCPFSSSASMSSNWRAGRNSIGSTFGRASTELAGAPGHPPLP